MSDEYEKVGFSQENLDKSVKHGFAIMSLDMEKTALQVETHWWIE